VVELDSIPSIATELCSLEAAAESKADPGDWHSEISIHTGVGR
jgi:hypothetical protein